MAYARETLLVAVDGLSRAELDHLYDANSNSIGALLAHAAAVERWYQIFTFEAREPSASDMAPWAAALNLGIESQTQLRGRELAAYVGDLAAIRQLTLSTLAERDDTWLESSLHAAPEMNAHWAWFHVAEDEINHRGQIRWLRTRLR